jgi:hypothetical protein
MFIQAGAAAIERTEHRRKAIRRLTVFCQFHGGNWRGIGNSGTDSGALHRAFVQERHSFGQTRERQLEEGVAGDDLASPTNMASRRLMTFSKTASQSM